MTDFGAHPRFPDDMTELEQIAVADEVDVTLAGFAGRKELAPAITAYAENLGGFIALDIRAGFALARKEAVEFAPTAGQVFACVGRARKGRLAREEGFALTSQVAPRPPLTEEDIPDWRAELRAAGVRPPGEEPIPEPAETTT